MIRVLVVDDDYHVAHAHALSVARVAGVHGGRRGAHRRGGARARRHRAAPDLLLLDMYLPDFSGLELVRQVAASGERVPDFLLVTAARDIEAVRTAMQLGAFYYLVKPFSFADAATSSWSPTGRGSSGSTGCREADQQVVDTLYSLRGTPSPARGSDPHAAADHGPGPRDRLLGAVAGRRRRGGRDPRRKPPDRPEVPCCPRQEAAARPRPELRRDGTTRAQVPPPPRLSRGPARPGCRRAEVGDGATRTWGRRRQRNAEMPVISRPRISDWMESVPS